MRCIVTTYSAREPKNALPSFRVSHAMDSDGRPNDNVVHILRRDEHILLLVRLVRGVDLRMQVSRDIKSTQGDAHHHLHADAAIDGVHEDIELI